MDLGGGFNFFYFHPYLGKIPKLTNIFQIGWNHQPDEDDESDMNLKFVRGCRLRIWWLFSFIAILLLDREPSGVGFSDEIFELGKFLGQINVTIGS